MESVSLSGAKLGQRRLLTVFDQPELAKQSSFLELSTISPTVHVTTRSLTSTVIATKTPAEIRRISCAALLNNFLFLRPGMLFDSLLLRSIRRKKEQDLPRLS